MLVAVQIPFLFTGHVQEDAYITFRCAANLAATGVYGFNPGETVSASTSHLAVALAAIARLLSGEMFIPVMQGVYACSALFATFFVSRSLVGNGNDAVQLWVITALTPGSLLIAYSGMETGLLLLATAGLIHTLATGRSAWTSWVAAALLPWIRPDAVAAGLLVVGAGVVTGSLGRRHAGLLVAIMCVSVATWFGFNRAYFGTYLTQTIIAKALLWSPRSMNDAFSAGLRRTGALFVGHTSDPAIFVPIRTRYLAWAGPLALVVSIGATASMWRSATERRGPVLALALIAFVLPAGYATGGRVYPWYTWPSTWAATILVVASIVTWPPETMPRVRGAARRAGLLLVPLGVVGQLLFAVSWGTQERLYRGGIGEWLAAISRPGDTLLLEPAGYIPYFAGLRTDDEIGLASVRVTAYRRRYGAAWWPRFVEDVQPTVLIERAPMRTFVTLDGYALSEDEREWFERSYSLVKVFTYEPERLRSNPVARTIARFGSAGEYLVYRRRD